MLWSNFESDDSTLCLFVSAGYLYFALKIVLGKIFIALLWVNSTGKLENICGVLHRMASRVVLPRVWAA